MYNFIVLVNSRFAILFRLLALAAPTALRIFAAAGLYAADANLKLARGSLACLQERQITLQPELLALTRAQTHGNLAQSRATRRCADANRASPPQPVDFN